MGSKYVVTGSYNKGHWSNWSLKQQKSMLEDNEMLFHQPYVRDEWTQDERSLDTALTEVAHILCKKDRFFANLMANIHYEHLYAVKDRLAMPAPPNYGFMYFTYNGPTSKIYWDFIDKYHDLCLERALAEKDENLLQGLRKLGINYADALPYNPEFHPGDDFITPDRYCWPDGWLEIFRSTLWKALWDEFDRTDWQAVHCHVRAHTSIGDNYDVFGNPFSIKEWCYPLTNNHTSPMVKKKSGATFKWGYLNRPDLWRSDAQYFERLWMDCKEPLTPDNLEKRLRHGTIARCRNFIRYTSPDEATTDQFFLKDGYPTSKDRKGSRITVDNGKPVVHYYVGISSKVAQHYREDYGHRGFPARLRRVNAVDVMMQRAMNFFLHGVTSTMEGPNGGFLAIKKRLLDRHDRFVSHFKHFRTFKGDRTNAEKYITSNKEFMEKLWDPVFHDLVFNGYRPKIMPDLNRGFRVMAQCFGSGEATTSFDNILAGNADKICFLTYSAKLAFNWDDTTCLNFIREAVEFLTKQVDAVLWLIKDKVGLFLNLSTDDIADEIGWTDEGNYLAETYMSQLKKFADRLDQRKLSLEWTNGQVSYGVMQMDGVWTPGTGTSLKSVAAIENAGDYLRDCYSVATRAADSGTIPEFDAALQYIEHKYNLPHSGFDFYKEAVPRFLRRCKEYSDGVEEDINLYSSSQRRLYADILKSMQVPEEDIELALDPLDLESEIPICSETRERFLKPFLECRRNTTYVTK